jgi:hypothetical protein
MKTLLASMLGIALLFSVKTLHAAPIGPSPIKTTPAKKTYTVKWKTNGYVQIAYKLLTSDEPVPTPKVVIDKINDAKDLGMGTKIEKTQSWHISGNTRYRTWGYAKRDNYIEKTFSTKSALDAYVAKVKALIPAKNKDGGPNLRMEIKVK